MTAGLVPSILKPYRQAVDLVEVSGLDYTILKSGWFDNGMDESCQISRKGETFYGHDVSRLAIISLVKEMIDQPDLYMGESLGLCR